MENREDWLKGRKTYIGGSDIGAIVGVNKYKTAVDVYLGKTSEEVEEQNTDAIYWGNSLEGVVAQAYSERTGFAVEIEPNIIRHKDYPFLAANIDRWADNKNHILECKTAGFMMAKDWGEEYTDQIPESYLCQVAWYAGICEVERVDIAVLIGGQDFRIYSYTANRAFQEKLIKVGINFWNNHVLKNMPPEIKHVNDVMSLYPVSKPIEAKANSEVIAKLGTIKALKAQDKQLNDSIKTLELEVKEYMKEAELLVDNSGKCLASWKTAKPRQSLDTKKLKAEHEDIYKEYMKESEPSRMFLIK